MAYSRNLRRSVFIVCLLFLMGYSRHALAGPLKAEAKIIDSQRGDVGSVLFTESPGGAVKIDLELHSFLPGEHAMHIHGSPVCDVPDFKSAGGHFNPGGKKHGFLNREGHHAGDLPNIRVDEAGNCRASFETDQVTLRKGEKNSILEQPTSLVIHEAPDDYFTDPAGNAGKRIACGPIVEAE
jgi:Cu-Zn family superoxide dismutase